MPETRMDYVGIAHLFLFWYSHQYILPEANLRSQLIIGGLETTNKYELDAIYNGLSTGLQQWELESIDTRYETIF